MKRERAGLEAARIPADQPQPSVATGQFEDGWRVGRPITPDHYRQHAAASVAARYEELIGGLRSISAPTQSGCLAGRMAGFEDEPVPAVEIVRPARITSLPLVAATAVECYFK
jgi:hypothetical protein